MDIQWIAAPKKLLYIFETYPDSRRWLDNNRNEIVKLGGVIKLTTNEIIFPNGNILYLGHADREKDLMRYWSLEYDIVSGEYDKFLKSRELSIRKF